MKNVLPEICLVYAWHMNQKCIWPTASLARRASPGRRAARWAAPGPGIPYYNQASAAQPSGMPTVKARAGSRPGYSVQQTCLNHVYDVYVLRYSTYPSYT